MIPDRVRERTRAGTQRLGDWVRATDRRRGVIDVGEALVDRDREAVASVMGAAIALRMFLFYVPLLVMIVGVIAVTRTTGIVTDVLGGVDVNTSMTAQIESAVASSHRNGIWFIITGLVLSVWAGRNLTSVLAASSVAGWHMDKRAAKVGVRTVLMVTALMAAFGCTPASSASVAQVWRRL